MDFDYWTMSIILGGQRFRWSSFLSLRSFYFTHLSVSIVCAQGIIFVAKTASNNQSRYSLPLRLRLASRIDASGHFFPQNCARTESDLVIVRLRSCAIHRMWLVNKQEQILANLRARIYYYINLYIYFNLLY